MSSPPKDTDFLEAIGVLIGFAWEKCFDVAVNETAEKDRVFFFWFQQDG